MIAVNADEVNLSNENINVIKRAQRSLGANTEVVLQVNAVKIT